MGLHTSTTVSFKPKDSSGENAQRNITVKSLRKTASGNYIEQNDFLTNETVYFKIYTGDGVAIDNIETLTGSTTKKVSEQYENVPYTLEFTLNQYEAEQDGGANTATVPHIPASYKLINSPEKLGAIIKTGAQEFTAANNAWALATIEYSVKVQIYAMTPSNEIQNSQEQIQESVKIYAKEI